MPASALRQQPLDLAELGVGLLQLGGSSREHVEAVVVADGHLVGEPAEIPGELGDAFGQLTATAAQLGHRTAQGRPTEAPDRHDRTRSGLRSQPCGPFAKGCRWPTSSNCPHPQPVSIGWSPRALISSSCFLPVVLLSFFSLAALNSTGFGGGAFSAAVSFASVFASSFSLAADLLAVLDEGVVLLAAVLVGAVPAAAGAVERPSTLTIVGPARAFCSG